jgi:chromosome segregation ATPase
MAKQIKTPKAEKAVPGYYRRIISAMSWGTLPDEVKREAAQQKVMVALLPDQWESMREEQRIASDLREKLREELRVANMKLDQTQDRLRNLQTAQYQQMEGMRSELTKAREESIRLARGMHALIDSMAPQGPKLLTPREAYEQMLANSNGSSLGFPTDQKL